MSDTEDIARAVVEALEKSRHISREDHHEHHSYLAGKIARDKKWAEVLDQVKLHLMKYGALAVMSALFVAAWQYFKLSIHG